MNMNARAKVFFETESAINGVALTSSILATIAKNLEAVTVTGYRICPTIEGLHGAEVIFFISDEKKFIAAEVIAAGLNEEVDWDADEMADSMLFGLMSAATENPATLALLQDAGITDISTGSGEWTKV